MPGCAAGFNLRTKYKGHHNRNTQIRSTFSQDGTFLICGSDDGWVYIWTTGSGADDDKLPKQVGTGYRLQDIFAQVSVHTLGSHQFRNQVICHGACLAPLDALCQMCMAHHQEAFLAVSCVPYHVSLGDF